MSDMRGERLQVMLSPEELTAIDDFRFKHRMPTRAAAVRELLKMGLTVVAADGGGMKSSNYGVFSRGPDGHIRAMIRIRRSKAARPVGQPRCKQAPRAATFGFRSDMDD